MNNNSIMHTKRLIIMYRVITVRLKYKHVIVFIKVLDTILMVMNKNDYISVIYSLCAVYWFNSDKTSIIHQLVHAVTIYFAYDDVCVTGVFSHDFIGHGYVVVICYSIYQ